MFSVLIDLRLIKFLNFLFSLFFIHFSLYSQQITHIEPKVWSLVQPYLLPNSHPIKKKLDKIFSKRVILSIESMKKAGFIEPMPRKFTRLIVTKHPKLKGFIIKTYVDAQRYHKDKPEYLCWVDRIRGAQAIQTLIDKKQWHAFFKVPKKWIYALPSSPSPPKEYQRKNFILVEEDMDLWNENENKKIWKSEMISKNFLAQLFYILNKIGLYDCTRIDNIPFSKDGRIAFIDTYGHHVWPVPFKNLTSVLSSSNQTYWKELIQTK